MFEFLLNSNSSSFNSAISKTHLHQKHATSDSRKLKKKKMKQNLTSVFKKRRVFQNLYYLDSLWDSKL